MHVNLGEFHRDLEGLVLIRGRGLTSNVYLILGSVGLVDTGSGPPLNPLSGELKNLGIGVDRVSKVLLTHSHPDHVGGLRELISNGHPTVYAHPSAFEELQRYGKAVSAVDEGTIRVGDLTLKVIYTPGHSSDSLCLYSPSLQALFSGDTLFPNGNIGRTDLPTGNHSQLISSLRTLTRLPVRHLLPGHENPVMGEGYKHVRAGLHAAEELFPGMI